MGIVASKSLTLVYYRGAWQIAQLCDFNPAPCGQGVEIHRFLTIPKNISKLKAVIDADLLYEPTQDQKDLFEADARSLSFLKEVEYVKERNKNGDVTFSFYDITNNYKEKAFRAALRHVCPTMLGEIGAMILEHAAVSTKPFPIIKTTSFANVSWAYVIDLDEDLLEVFGYKDQGCMGGECRVIENHRFDEVDWAGPSGPPGDCLGQWKFSRIPTRQDFLLKLRDYRLLD
ncbi:hypothetical protein BFW01_g12666 [Lasiodiplodia theobromae]|nr:hypothetical protein BFW01_g12666 [Lasiodiplodia theobromae]